MLFIFAKKGRLSGQILQFLGGFKCNICCIAMADNSLHLRVRCISGDQHQRVGGLILHPLLNQFDIGAGGVDVGDVVLLKRSVDRPRHTVRPDDDRNRRVGLCLQREQLLELFDRDGPQRAQLLDYLAGCGSFRRGYTALESR